MELMDDSLDKLYQLVYHKLNQSFPERILGKMAVAVSMHIAIHITTYYGHSYVLWELIYNSNNIS